MNSQNTSRLTILECMALTAAVGAGFWLARFTADEGPPSPDIRWVIARGSWAVALPMTWMLVALRLFGSHPARRYLFRPPGIVACIAVVVASFCMLVFWSHNFVSNRPVIDWISPRFLRAALRHILGPQPLAASVAAVWITLVVNGRWRPEPSWIDRAGRIVGVYWLAAGLAIPGLNIWVNWQ